MIGRWHLAHLVALAAAMVAIVAVETGLREPTSIGVELPVPSALGPSIAAVRAALTAGIHDPRAAAIASGVVFGRTEHVAPEDETAFLESGLWHLLAASGQNVALVATCCILLARAAGAGRTTGAVVGLVAVPAYVLVVGGGPSIVRAGIMGELGILAWLLGRLADARQLLLVAIALICWAAPGAHRSLGLQLSAACVAALLVWVVPLTMRLRVAGVPSALAGGLATTGLCSLVTAPILVLRTGAAPATGAVANVLAVPLAGAILVIGLGATAVQLAGDALGVRWPGELLMTVAGWLAAMLREIALRAAAAPAAQVTSRLLAVGVPVSVLGWAIVGPARRRLRRIAVVTGVVCALVPTLRAAAERAGVRVGGPPALVAGHARIAVLDIGQGDATLLTSGGGAVLVDTGPPDGDVVRRVRELGIRRLDGIVLTHDSLDHRGGFGAAFAALHPAWVAMPAHAPGSWRRVRSLAGDVVELCAGSDFAVGSLSLEVLNPPCDGRVRQRTTDVHNDGAMVLLARHRAATALLPADAEAPVLVRIGLPRLDLLRVSHHGSADPDLPRLLTTTAPALAAVSVGAGNDYGHPTPATLAALRAAGVQTSRTDEDGSIVFDSDGRRFHRTH